MKSWKHPLGGFYICRQWIVILEILNVHDTIKIHAVGDKERYEEDNSVDESPCTWQKSPCSDSSDKTIYQYCF